MPSPLRSRAGLRQSPTSQPASSSALSPTDGVPVYAQLPIGGVLFARGSQARRWPRPWMARHGQRPRAATRNGGGGIDGRPATGNVHTQHANTPRTAATTFTCSHGQQRCGAGTRLPRSGQEGVTARHVQLPASMDEKAVVPPISVDSNAVDLPSEGHAQASTSNMDGGHNGAHNFYASQAQPFYYLARREAWDMIATVFYSVLNNVRCR